MKYVYVFALLGIVVGLIACSLTSGPLGPLNLNNTKIPVLASVQLSSTPIPNSVEKWSERSGHQVVAFDDGDGEALYLLGGWDGRSSFNDVWRSPDGIHWTQVETSNSIWSEREGHQVVVFDDGSGEALYLMGGRTAHDLVNDVWRSPDGVRWEEIITNAPWGARVDHQVVAFYDRYGSDEALYLMGGYAGFNTGTTHFNDVWTSPDGSNWTEVITNGPWSKRREHQVVVFDDRSGSREALYLMGGVTTTSNSSNVVWTSPDGITWTQVTANAPWSKRRLHQVVVFDDGAGSGEALYLMGGWDDTVFFNDVWKSPDGSRWEELTTNAAWSKRRGHQVVVFDDGDGEVLFLMGGVTTTSNPLNDVWRSTDGENWEDMDDYLIEEPLGLALDEDEDIYLLGTNTNQVIVLKKASSGTAFLAEFSGTTTETITDSAVFSSDNVLYIVGGKLDGAPSNSIYAYNTLSKEFQDSGSPLPQAVFGHHLQVLGDCVYILNGTNDSGAPVNYKNCDPSLNSLQWVALTSVNDADITNFASLVSGSGIYLVGGLDVQGKALNSTYLLRTNDELIAIPENDPYGLISSYGSTGIVVSGTFLLLGGQDAAGALNADVYQSVDGGGQWITINSLSLETVKNFVVQTRQEPLTLYVYGQRQNSLEGDIFYTIEFQEE